MRLPTKMVLTLEFAKHIAEACRDGAHARGCSIDVAIVDSGGHLVYFEREDGVAPGTVQVAILKASSSALFGAPSKQFETTVSDGLIGLAALPGMAAFEGAVPITAGDEIIGAVAVSGATKEIDGQIAQLGAEAAASALAD